MNKNQQVLNNLINKIVDEGKATIKLGTHESKALIEIVFREEFLKKLKK